MSDDPRATSPEAIARTAMIVAGALMAGVLTFLGVAVVIRSTGGKGLFAPAAWSLMPPGALISLVALAMAATVVSLAFTIPAVIAKKFLQAAAKAGPGAEPIYFTAYLQQMIVGLALLEGAAFANGVAYLVEGRAPNLIVAGLLVALMAAKFPTPNGIRMWVEDRSARVREGGYGD